ncbi:MAG: nucleotide pyrophosphohydrolase [Pirellulales bacterium]
MSDQTTTVAELRELMRTFVDERNWRIHHAPKNLAMSLAIEAGELMEHFQWCDVETSRAMRDDPGKVRDIGEELSDVVCYALALANALNLDLSDALRAKMLKNAIKYPKPETTG